MFSVDNEYECNDWDYRLNRVVCVLPDKGGENSSHTDPGDGEEVVTANLMYEQTSEGMSLFHAIGRLGYFFMNLMLSSQGFLCDYMSCDMTKQTK